ncbi:MAG TPA: DMT family transporter, partial [Gammaproteobacteria bacterium]|nr:DMT family transporter [Gammaproteobacteria bacterium]
MNDLSPHAKGLLITTLGVLVLTPDSLLIRLVSADAWTLTFWRGVLYAIGMSVAVAVMFGGRARQQFLAMGVPGVLIGVIFGLGKVTFIVSITNTTAANTLFIVSTSPLFAAVVAWLLMREPVARRTWLAIGFALLGIGVIASEGVDRGSVIGNVAALLTALVLGTSFALARRHRERNVIPAMALSGLISALMVLPLASPLSVVASDMAALGIMGLVVLPLSFGLIFIGPRYIPAPEVSLVLVLEAVLGPFWVWLALGEEP